MSNNKQMSKQEILDGIDKAIDVFLTYEEDDETNKIIEALNSAWEKVKDGNE